MGRQHQRQRPLVEEDEFEAAQKKSVTILRAARLLKVRVCDAGMVVLLGDCLISCPLLSCPLTPLVFPCLLPPASCE
jgi:hypothetical protein